MMEATEIYLSRPHPCDYLPQREARMLFLAPDLELSMADYSHLVAKGFRRSGRLIYRPHCGLCQACVSVRIPVHRFRPDRSQRRCLQRNRDLKLIARPAQFRDEHYDLYLRYLKARHPGGDMAESTPEDYSDFLICSWCDTLFYEFRLRDRLLAVAVVDLLDDGLSAVYTFFDPDHPRRGLGTYAILTEIEAARRMGLDYLYLGYWIAACDKMAYKHRFQPLEYYADGCWLSDHPPILNPRS